MSEIENSLCVRIVTNVNPVLKTERETWGAISVLRKFNDGVYICLCSVKYEEYRRKIKPAFAIDIHFKPLHQSKCCGDLIENRTDASICVLEYNDR